MTRNKRRLLLLSSSRTAGTEYLEHARDYLRSFLNARARTLLFVPYARVSNNYDDYLERVRANFAAIGYEATGLHSFGDPVRAINKAEALVVGGGNTYQLLRELYANKLMAIIRQRVLAGMPYIGWSAGSNVACPTICTTNDMPVVWPERCEALNLIPFQINPHYTDAQLPGFQGEARAERLQEYVRANPKVPVVGLREGSALRIEGNDIQLLGLYTARLFTHAASREITPREPLGFLAMDN
ncbi:MAG TPA: dipeptidase PepE [Gammaproteobacteria bacterium]|nr:dipeptidase PepE [Gammaproteobacteria bacterium]